MRNPPDPRNDAARRLFVPSMLAGCLAILCASSARSQIADVVAAFEEIPGQATALTFDRGAFELPRGGHLQGIQMRFDPDAGRHLVFLSHDSATVAYLAIVEFPADLSGPGRLVHVHTFPGDGRSPPLRHAGGIQLSGDVLVVGLEDNQQKTRSEIQFWNVADPKQPAQLEHLTVRRSGVPKDKTAGAVGLVKRESDYLLAVGNWDSRAIDFYTSAGKLLNDPQCRFELKVRWRDSAADKESWQPDRVFASYQAINLVTDSKGNLFLIGPHTSAGKDSVDLFAIDMAAEPNKLVRKLESRAVRLPPGNHFRSAGGVWITKDRLAILSSPRNFAANTRIGVARQLLAVHSAGQ